MSAESKPHSIPALRELLTELNRMSASAESSAAANEGYALLAGLEEQLEAVQAERDSLMADSWRAFSEAGGDTDGDLKWHCTPAMAGMGLIDAVVELRRDYDAALVESNPASTFISAAAETPETLSTANPASEPET